MPSDLLQVFLVGLGILFELGNLLFELRNLLVVIRSHHGTLNLILYTGYPVLIPLTIAGAQVLSCVNYHSMLLLPLTRIEPVVSDNCHLELS